MNKQIIFLGAGLVVGALSVLVYATMNDGDKAAETARLAETSAKIEALQAQLQEMKQRSEKPMSLPPAEAVAVVEEERAPEPEEGGETDPQKAFADLVNSKEARELMKQAMSAFGNNSERFISGMVNRYKESLGLTDAQVTSITKRLADNARKQQETFASGLDNENKTIEELMREQGGGWQGQQEEMSAILKEELTEDQYAQYEREQLVQQAQRIERQSQRELDRLSTTLELDDAQQDQVFDVLVRTSPGYDDAMQVEGIQSSGVTGDAANLEREAAVRAVLTPEQAAKYDADLANPATQRRGRWGGWGGGGFPGR